MSSDRERIVRRLARLVVLAYQRKGYLPDVACLARGEGCHPRTVYRDLRALKAAGVPVRRMNRERAE